MKKLNSIIGYVELTLAQVCLGVSIILGKILAPLYPIFSLLTLRFFIGFTIIAIYLWMTDQSQIRQEIKMLGRREWIILTMQALCAGFLFNTLTLYGLQYASASVTGILHSAMPALVVFFSFLFLKERLTKYNIFGILLSIIGILLLSFGDPATPSKSTELRGLLFIFLAIIPGSLFSIFAKMMKSSINPLIATAFLNLLNAFLFLLLAPNDELILFSTASFGEWLKIFFYSISGSVLFFVFWYRGLRHTPVNLAALFIGIMPISTCVLAYFFLNETLGLFDMMGMSCVIISIFTGTQRSQTKNANSLTTKTNLRFENP